MMKAIAIAALVLSCIFMVTQALPQSQLEVEKRGVMSQVENGEDNNGLALVMEDDVDLEEEEDVEDVLEEGEDMDDEDDDEMSEEDEEEDGDDIEKRGIQKRSAYVCKYQRKCSYGYWWSNVYCKCIKRKQQLQIKHKPYYRHGKGYSGKYGKRIRIGHGKGYFNRGGKGFVNKGLRKVYNPYSRGSSGRGRGYYGHGRKGGSIHRLG